MGNVRTSHVKNLAQKLFDLYPKKFTEDFKKNKQKVEVLTKGTSKKLRIK